MSESISRKRTRIKELAGPLAKTKVFVNKYDVVRSIITCRDCGWMNGSDGKSVGSGSTMFDALAQWSDHLRDKHNIEQRPLHKP